MCVQALNISKEDEFEHVWDLLHIQNEPIAANVPWMVGNGNHEVSGGNNDLYMVLA